MYKFSAPMPYNSDDINKLLDINKTIEKSKITSLYCSLPETCELYTGFEQSRNFTFEHTDWDYWKRLINQTFDLNCDFIYLLNSPRPLDIDNPDFPKSLEKLDLLLTELRALGVKKLRVASAQLMTYIAKHYSYFEILASTSLEYKTIWEYQNFIAFHPEIKQIVPSHDVNKNFLLLKNLRKRYPNVEIELMVNEGCLQGCPNRMLHEQINITKKSLNNIDSCFSNMYTVSFCRLILKKSPFLCLVKSGNVYPWEIAEYEKIGINNFKLVGREGYIDYFEYIMQEFYMYLNCIENLKLVNEYPIVNLNHHCFGNPNLQTLSIKEYKKYFPKIEHFKKYGHLCSSRCTVECTYCHKCSEKIEKVFKKNTKKEKPFIQACKINTI